MRAARRRLAAGPGAGSPAAVRDGGSVLRRRLAPPEIVGGLLIPVVGIAFMATRDANAPVRPRPAGLVAPVTPAGPGPDATRSLPVVGRVTSLDSRFADASTLEVWGAADGPDGSTVRVQVGAGRSRTVARAPVASQRFYATIRLPQGLRGRRVHIRAAIRP